MKLDINERNKYIDWMDTIKDALKIEIGINIRFTTKQWLIKQEMEDMEWL